MDDLALAKPARIVRVVQPYISCVGIAQGFRAYWRWKSRAQAGRPPVSRELQGRQGEAIHTAADVGEYKWQPIRPPSSAAGTGAVLAQSGMASRQRGWRKKLSRPVADVEGEALASSSLQVRGDAGISQLNRHPNRLRIRTLLGLRL